MELGVELETLVMLVYTDSRVTADDQFFRVRWTVVHIQNRVFYHFVRV